MQLIPNQPTDGFYADARETKPRPIETALLAAALILPLSISTGKAETPPEKATVAYKYLDYLDSQPDADRVRVRGNALMLTTPMGESWSFTGTAVTDAVSGASPRFHTSRLTRLTDFRRAQTAAFTRYFSRSTLTVSAANSDESDYQSTGLSASYLWYPDDSKNTAFTVGIGGVRDTINPSNNTVTDERKQVNDLIFGITQVFTVNDVGQVIFRRSDGRGYFSDPYKAFDERPRERDIQSLLLRWNHHFADWDSTLRSSYRFYSDSFDIKAHTLGIEWVQPVTSAVTVTPLIRLYSQTAASFYVPANPLPNGLTFPAEDALYYSEDQRLSAFGAVTLGFKVGYALTRDLSVDVKYESYRQRAGWSVSGGGDPLLAPFNARSVQAGVTYQF